MGLLSKLVKDKTAPATKMTSATRSRRDMRRQKSWKWARAAVIGLGQSPGLGQCSKAAADRLAKRLLYMKLRRANELGRRTKDALARRHEAAEKD